MNTCPNCGMNETRTQRGYAEYECGTSVPDVHSPKPLQTTTCKYVGNLLKRALESETKLTVYKSNQKEIERKFSKICKRKYAGCCDECPLEFTTGKDGDNTKCMACMQADKRNHL